MTMNGAESLVRTLLAGGVDVSFTNPGTSEMHFVAALDRVEGMRCVLCLFEGVVTGAADGYARMAEKPASSLLHLGPGLGNGIANLHNARRAFSPMVNIIGEHATWHIENDAPLTSDIEGLAGPVSQWLRTSRDSTTVAADGAEAIAAAMSPPGRIASLILPADTAWGDGGGIAPVPSVPARRRIDEATLRKAAEAVKLGPGTMLFMGHRAVRQDAVDLAGRITTKTGARMLAMMSNPRIERGGARVFIDRLPYPVDPALEKLKDVRRMVLVGCRQPVAFFGYPGKPGKLAPPDCEIIELAGVEEDVVDALARLADAVGATATAPVVEAFARPGLPTGAIDGDKAGAVIGALLPEGAIVCDESVTTGRNIWRATAGAPEHDWLQLTGGAIGVGLPMATGAAVACPDRKVISLEADGSGMYTVQALWTQAREGLNVLTVIWSNREYAILRGELANVGAKNPGRKALDMLSLDDPALGWVDLARGLGVEGRRVETAEDFAAAFRAGLAVEGPYLIEVVL
jgi:acetolactate synthase-1/2/3 large subunit